MPTRVGSLQYGGRVASFLTSIAKFLGSLSPQHHTTYPYEWNASRDDNRLVCDLHGVYGDPPIAQSRLRLVVHHDSSVIERLRAPIHDDGMTRNANVNDCSRWLWHVDDDRRSQQSSCETSVAGGGHK